MHRRGDVGRGEGSPHHEIRGEGLSLHGTESESRQPNVRPFRPNDLDAVKEIELDFQRESGLQPPPGYSQDLDDIDGVYVSSGGGFWVVECDGEVAGYGAVLRIDDGTARLRRFRVRPQWRRRGLATLLLKTAEDFCRQHGYRRITLGTTEQQQAAQALYRKRGYVSTGERALTPELREIEFAKELR